MYKRNKRETIQGREEYEGTVVCQHAGYFKDNNFKQTAHFMFFYFKSSTPRVIIDKTADISFW